MINVLQIIIYMPLINVAFPMNAVLFYSFLMDMASFNLFSMDKINSGIGLKLKPSDTPNRFQMMGFHSSNVVSNLGSMFLYLLAIAGAIASVSFLKLCSLKCTCMKKVYGFLADKVLFNIPLRMLLVSFMRFFIDSCLNI